MLPQRRGLDRRPTLCFCGWHHWSSMGPAMTMGKRWKERPGMTASCRRYKTPSVDPRQCHNVHVTICHICPLLRLIRPNPVTLVIIICSCDWYCRTLTSTCKQLVWTPATLRTMWPNCSTLQSNEKKVGLATFYKQHDGLEAPQSTLNITTDTKHPHGL